MKTQIISSHRGFLAHKGVGNYDPKSLFVGLVSDIELMKERFAKLLLGEDMSGGGKGVSSALALSNAITNLAGISSSLLAHQRFYKI